LEESSHDKLISISEKIKLSAYTISLLKEKEFERGLKNANKIKKKSTPCSTKIKKKPMNQINLQQSPQRFLATCNNKRDIQGGKNEICKNYTNRYITFH